MNRPALVILGVLLGGIVVALVPGGGVERRVLPIQGGVEIAECLPDGTLHGESLVYRGWLSSRRVFDHVATGYPCERIDIAYVEDAK